MTPLRKRLRRALLAYAALAVAAGLTLDENWRVGVLVLCGALAVKSWLDVKRDELGS